MTDSAAHRLFNGPVELGLRILALLREAHPAEFSMGRLVILDYLIVHSDDLQNGPAGLHPKTPRRAGELLVRRDAIRGGLDLYRSRGLIRELLRPVGLRYQATEIAAGFLDSLSSPYAITLCNRAQWLRDSFGDWSDDELQQLVAANLGRWGAEFTMESVIWEEPFDQQALGRERA